MCLIISLDTIPGVGLLGQRSRSLGGKRPLLFSPHPSPLSCHHPQEVKRALYPSDLRSLRALVFWASTGGWGFPGGSVVKNLPASAGSLGQEDPLEKEMATHSSIFAWRISWTEELGRWQSLGSQRIRHDWATNQTTGGWGGMPWVPQWPLDPRPLPEQGEPRA